MAPQRATITSNQAVEAINKMLQYIDLNVDLRQTPFGRSVRLNLIQMRARLKDGRSLTYRMQSALDNWNVAIHRDLNTDFKTGTIQ